MDVHERAALQALYRLSVDTNLEFIRQTTKQGPLFTVMCMFRRDAIQALAGLVSVDPAKAEDIRKLQNEVQRFIDMVAFVGGIFKEGDEAALRLNTEEQEEVRDIIIAEGGEVPGEDE